MLEHTDSLHNHFNYVPRQPSAGYRLSSVKKRESGGTRALREHLAVLQGRFPAPSPPLSRTEPPALQRAGGLGSAPPPAPPCGPGAGRAGKGRPGPGAPLRLLPGLPASWEHRGAPAHRAAGLTAPCSRAGETPASAAGRLPLTGRTNGTGEPWHPHTAPPHTHRDPAPAPTCWYSASCGRKSAAVSSQRRLRCGRRCSRLTHQGGE